MHVVGAFVPDVWVALSDGLNALIGSKGAGKTALLECLRFALNTRIPSERQESVRKHVTHVLGPAGYVECLVQHADGTRSLITRRADAPDAEQTEDEVEREGIDVKAINRLAADYRRRFNGRELPHPKMDALVAHLADSWKRGRKALVFLRRVASVWEIKERLDLKYNDWLIDRLRRGFDGSPQLSSEIDALYAAYCAARVARRTGSIGCSSSRRSPGCSCSRARCRRSAGWSRPSTPHAGGRQRLILPEGPDHRAIPERRRQK
jgi:hypothetical protein